MHTSFTVPTTYLNTADDRFQVKKSRGSRKFAGQFAPALPVMAQIVLKRLRQAPYGKGSKEGTLGRPTVAPCRSTSGNCAVDCKNMRIRCKAIAVRQSNLDITLMLFNMDQFSDQNLSRSQAVPNHEIYYGDFINVLEGIAQGGDNRRIQLDSTDFTIHKRGATFYVNRDGPPIGHVTANIDGTTVRIG